MQKKAGKNIKNSNELNSLIEIAIRYVIALILGINLWLFYIVLLPVTFYPVVFILKLFFNIDYLMPYFSINGKLISIVGACIAASAYFLLITLNLLTNGIKLKTRIKMLFFCIFLLLAINIIRIFILSVLYVNSFSFFDLTHKILWYGLSAFFVLFIWLFAVKIFRVKGIPFYSDFLYIKSLIRKK